MILETNEYNSEILISRKFKTLKFHNFIENLMIVDLAIAIFINDDWPHFYNFQTFIKILLF